MVIHIQTVTMIVKKLFCKFKIILRVFVLFIIIVNVSGCNLGLDFLAEDLITALCPILASTSNVLGDLFKTLSIEEDGPISSDLVTECFKCGCELSRASKERGNKLVKNGIDLTPYSASLRHFFSPSYPAEVKKTVEVSHEILSTTKVLQARMCACCDVTPNTFMAFLENQIIKVHDPTLCSHSKVLCGKSKYRTMDGICNNELHPYWGRKGAPFTRIANPRYADGIYAMPVSKSGRDLPNPRKLSTRLFADRCIPSYVFTHINMQWGQFITHDMIFQTMEVTDEGGIQCCLGEGQGVLPAEWLNDKCIPISVPDDDPFYRDYGVKCLNMVRSLTTPREDCSLGHAEQMNIVTSFLDGSTIYGSDKKTAAKLRSKKGGKLKQVKKKNSCRGFPPSVDDKSATCDLRNSSDPCYFAGDARINQTPTLAMLHTLFLREHNRVAEILSDLNPLWSDEKLYQEARKIVVAEIQHITYQEWLPINLGENYVRYYRISPSSLYSRDYKDDVNPEIINSFGASAFRFMHSVIPDTIMACPSGYNPVYLHRLSDHYLNPSILETSSESFDDVVRGSIAHHSAEADPFVTGEITNLLFKSYNQWGLDLIAMDIQRGRDHGLASYNDYREIWGLRKARCFQDLAGEMSQDRINALAQLYECVDDVDLFVGGSLERDVQGSILGHTFHCIVAEQFYRTRVGDRFFYDNGEMQHSFTPDQLKEIKKTSMARIICDNTDGVNYVQKKAFELESSYNPKCNCDDYDSIPYMDLTAWKKQSLELFD